MRNISGFHKHHLEVKLLAFLMAALLFSSCSSRRYAQKPDAIAAGAATAMSNLKSKQLYKFITDWAGVKYRFGGLDKKGIDCSGFAFLLEKDIFGKVLPRRSRDQAEAVKEKDPDHLDEGDLVFFSFGGNQVDHVGIYLNNDYFVHASTSRGVIVDNIKLEAYQKTFIKAGTIKN